MDHFNSALFYCTAELLSWRGRPSSLRPSVDIVFSETVQWLDTKFWWQVPIFRAFFVCFSTFKIFDFLLVFVFVNIEPYERKKIKRHLLWKYTSDSLQKHAHFYEGSLPKLLKELWNSKFWNFAIFFFRFFSFSFLGPHGSKSFKSHLLWKNTPDLLPKFMDTRGESLYQSC